MCVYLVGGGFSEPSSRRRNTPPGPLGRGPRGPESSRWTKWGHRDPGTSSSDKAAGHRRQKLEGWNYKWKNTRFQSRCIIWCLWETRAALTKHRGNETERGIHVMGERYFRKDKKLGKLPCDVIGRLCGLPSRQWKNERSTVTFIWFLQLVIQKMPTCPSLLGMK